MTVSELISAHTDRMLGSQLMQPMWWFAVLQKDISGMMNDDWLKDHLNKQEVDNENDFLMKERSIENSKEPRNKGEKRR